MRAADAGDADALRQSLTTERDLDHGDAREIARRFMGQQIVTAQGGVGEKSLAGLEPCAALFDDALRARAEHDDELAARAMMLRIDAGQVPMMRHVDRVTSAHAHWRAVGARSLGVAAPSPALKGDDDELVKAGVWRRALMLDPSTDVRVAALRAAHDAADPADVGHVLEAGRLDPDETVRSVAIQAAGKIGTLDAVRGLADIWVDANEDARLAIVGAWVSSARKGRAHGPVGCRQADDASASCAAWHKLMRVSDMGASMPSLIASLELIHDVAPADATSVEGNAAAVVERMIDDESTRVRVEAIQSAPLSWAHLAEAIVDASKGHDELVAVAALARMAELGGRERRDAIAALRKLARKDGLGAERARFALATLRDGDVVKLLETDAKAKSAEQRANAATRYALLGEVNAALALLADSDPRVRSRAACAILEMEE
jgi:hypothetical protein